MVNFTMRDGFTMMDLNALVPGNGPFITCNFMQDFVYLL